MVYIYLLFQQYIINKIANKGIVENLTEM